MPNEDVVRVGLILAGMLVGPLVLSAVSLLWAFDRAAQSEQNR